MCVCCVCRCRTMLDIYSVLVFRHRPHMEHVHIHTISFIVDLVSLAIEATYCTVRAYCSRLPSSFLIDNLSKDGVRNTLRQNLCFFYPKETWDFQVPCLVMPWAHTSLLPFTDTVSGIHHTHTDS